MTAIAFTCTGCSARQILDHPVSGSIPACASCGGVLRLAVAANLAATVQLQIDDGGTLDTADPALPRLNAGGLLPGDRFGRYEIERELARGGMGIVYVVRDPTLKRRVALKVLIAGEFADGEAVRRFVREARSAGQLRHPNIIAVHDAGEVDGRNYFTMDLVEGRELGQLPDEGVSLRELVGIMRTVAQALHHAHSHGVVHRDLKPANIMVERDGRPLVMDFGLAKDVSGNASFRSLSGMVAGTPAYMSPEQAQGLTAEIDHRTDVYALGVILYELATGRRPFGGSTMFDTIRAVVSDEPAPPAKLSVECDAALEAVILRCLEKNKLRRYANAEALADDLGRWLDGLPVQARAAGAVERGWRRLRAKPALLAGLGAGFVVVLALLAVGLVIVLGDDGMDRAEKAYAHGDERAHAALVLLAGQLAEDQVPLAQRERALALLRRAAGDGDAGREAVAGKALVALKDEAVGGILATLAESAKTPPDRRRQALAALAELGAAAEGREAIAGRLLALVREAQPVLAEQLATTALALDPPGVVDALAAIAADQAQLRGRRLAVLRALAVGNPATHGAAMQRLLRCAGDADAEIGAAAEAVLLRVRDREAVFAIFGVAGRAGNTAVAVAGMQRTVADNQRKLLALAGEDEEGNALGEKPKPEDPATVVAKGLADPDPARRATAAWDLGRIGGPVALAALTKALDDADPEVRRLAARALASLQK